MSKDHLVHKQFPLPKGCTIRSVTMREIDGHDEREAAKIMSARSNIDNPGVALMEEQIRVSIVAVDGEPVSQPFTGMNAWSTRTRRFIMEAFGHLNGVEDEELEDFLKAAKDPKETQPEAAESAQEMSEEDVKALQQD